MIDWSRVRELREEVGADDFRDILGIFFEELDETTARLAAMPPGSVAEDDIHFLKGCALNLGFAEVSALCSSFEATLASRR
jgi:Hpt domain.